MTNGSPLQTALIQNFYLCKFCGKLLWLFYYMYYLRNGVLISPVPPPIAVHQLLFQLMSEFFNVNPSGTDLVTNGSPLQTALIKNLYLCKFCGKLLWLFYYMYYLRNGVLISPVPPPIAVHQLLSQLMSEFFNVNHTMNGLHDNCHV